MLTRESPASENQVIAGTHRGGRTVAAFPIQPEQLSSEWFTKTLRASGKLASTNEVSGFEVGFIGDGVGLLGMVLRVSLKYARAEGAGPASVVIKFAHPVPENRAIAANLNMYEREVTFFNEIAPEVTSTERAIR
ncbi:MAG: hypothetical protein EBU67_05580 [Actinobacteria bacterium]|nr:hypothetical protein [Actinomycetota bacterium]